MAYRITEQCINCGVCEPECPNKAISEGETYFEIDPARCTECVGSHASPKCAEVCPVDSCVADPAYPEIKAKLLAKWRSLHPGEAPASGTY